MSLIILKAEGVPLSTTPIIQKDIHFWGAKVGIKSDIPKELLVQIFKQLILEDPDFNNAVGLPSPKVLQEYEKQFNAKQRFTLKQIGDFYFHRDLYSSQDPHKKHTINCAKNYWTEFCKIVGVKYIDEVDKNLVIEYAQEVKKVKKLETYKPMWLGKNTRRWLSRNRPKNKWVSARFKGVKSIVKNAPTSRKVDYTADIVEVHQLLKYNIVVPDPSADRKQVTIVYEKEQFHAFIKTCTNNINKDAKYYSKFKAMIIISLNCAFTQVDLIRLQFDDIDFKNKELRMVRQKTKTERYAVLWPETIKAIKGWLKINNPKKYDKYIFGENGKEMSRSTFDGQFKRLVKQVNQEHRNILDADLTFKYFRKSAETYAYRTKGAHPNEPRLLMGHRFSKGDIEKHYLLKAPDLVGNVCKQIYKQYYG